MIAIHGKTFEDRFALRDMGGVWDKREKVWRVPEDRAEEARRLVANGTAGYDRAALATTGMQSEEMAVIAALDEEADPVTEVTEAKPVETIPDFRKPDGAETRKQLHAALSASDDWEAYRLANNLDLATSTMDAKRQAYADLYHKPFEPEMVPVTAPVTLSGDSGNVAGELAAAIAKLMARPSGVDPATVKELVRAELRDAGELVRLAVAKAVVILRKELIPPQVQFTLTRPDLSQWSNGEKRLHRSFEELVRILSTGEHVWLAGPAGSGKTTAAEQAADALGKRFFCNGGLSGVHELLGWKDIATGTYHRTQFREAFENGGLWLKDECDTDADNSILLALNAALANGHCTFPDSLHPVAKHPDFVCIAAANTF